MLPGGNDDHTGHGRINVAQSMYLAARPSTGLNPGMTVVPNAGQRKKQWFNFMGSGFTEDGAVKICWTPPGQAETCSTSQEADDYGVAGIGIQPSASSPTGIWTVYMEDVTTQIRTPTQTFTVYTNE